MSLIQLPSQFVTTREALHQIAFYAISPARYQAEGRMGLRATPGGFGTPEFDGKVARVQGAALHYEQEGNIATRTITTIRAAAEFFGIDYQEEWFDDFRDPPPPRDPDSALEVDDTAARALGQWFGFGFEVLEKLGAQGVDGDEVSDVQLWPEHLDAALEMGNDDKGLRASYGASPGDDRHTEPYVYVSAWGEIDRSNPYWNDEAFNGASLGYDALLTAVYPVELALDFLLRGYGILHTD